MYRLFVNRFIEDREQDRTVQVVVTAVPRQTNGCDCGLFVVEYCKALAKVRSWSVRRIRLRVRSARMIRISPIP